MGVITAATQVGGQGVIKVFTFTTVADGDTFAGPPSPKGFWFQTVGNPSTQAAAGSSVTESSGTYTFYPGEDSQAGSLFVLL